MLDTSLIPPGLRPTLYQPGFERWLHVMGNSLQVITGCAELGYLAQCPQAQTMMNQSLGTAQEACAPKCAAVRAASENGEYN
jgi:hypothetical protein